MCGILGCISTRAPGDIQRDLDRALSTLTHRGPDDGAIRIFSAPSGSGPAYTVGLAHRRLSIIDLSAAGRQPLTLHDRPLWIIANAEFYNYRELRPALEAQGVRFHSSTDTEVALAAIACRGVAALADLEGMFALAVYDSARGCLLLARDPFGIKPLYYTRAGDDYVFASEVAALLTWPGVSRRANHARVFEHLQHWTTDAGDETFFAAIRQVPPGHLVDVRLSEGPWAEARPYVRFDLDRRLAMSLPDAAARLRGLLAESVEWHLRSDVPAGVALSGGTDSSSITMLARQVLGRDAPLTTVSYIADDPALNEEVWIDAVNLQAGARPSKLRIGDGDLAAEFDAFVRVQQQPTMSPVVYAQHRVYRQAREAGLKVLLEGQGSDEILAGYSFYLHARLASLIRAGRLVRAHRLLRDGSARFQVDRRWVVRHAFEACLAPGVMRWIRRARGGEERNPWIDAAWAAARGLAPRGSWTAGGPDYLRGMMHEAMTRTKLPALLRYGDHNAMAVSIENRVPFLTRRLVQFLFELPEEYILADDGTSKNVLRLAMQGITPELVLRRRIRIGFEPPAHRWVGALLPRLRQELSSLDEFPMLDRRAVAASLAGLGDRALSIPEANQLWRLVSLVAWTRAFAVDLS